MMFHYATCARLLNHPDAEGDAGRRIVPDVAEDLPEVSDGGRTYTFRIRRGFGFSPPSNEEVTAESFRHALERGIELAEAFDYDSVPAAQYRRRRRRTARGKPPHIAGVSAHDDTLVVRLRVPAPDLPWLAALRAAPFPWTLPSRKAVSRTPVPSAGPYYLAE